MKFSNLLLHQPDCRVTPLSFYFLEFGDFHKGHELDTMFLKKQFKASRRFINQFVKRTGAIAEYFVINREDKVDQVDFSLPANSSCRLSGSPESHTKVESASSI